VSIIDIQVHEASDAWQTRMPYRNYNRAQSSQSMPQLHLEAVELRSPPSHQLARLGRIRRRPTHRYLEHRLEIIWNQSSK
jgi:hypothetical protein